MKLIVQIPCFNEADTLAATLADLPNAIPGIDTIETLIVDDGSSDGTVEVARRLGVTHIVRHRRNRGLAKTFSTALQASLRLGADVIVNTDGDNQYYGGDIPALVAPILDGRADLVVGDRQTSSIDEFSPLKRLLQRLGSHAVRHFSGLDIPDAVSGFRAISREAALKINIVSNFSYTIEMLLQAGDKRIATTSVPVRTNPKTRDSRLFRSIPHFISRSLATLFRIYAMYKPLRVFLAAGLAITAIGSAPMLRFLVYALNGDSEGHIQSLVIGSALLTVGVLVLALGVTADLIRNNRILLEQSLLALREMDLRLAAMEAKATPRAQQERLQAALTEWPAADKRNANQSNERQDRMAGDDQPAAAAARTVSAQAKSA
ncbi:N-glycosyltransferase [Hartmannibacter diazotrophicus]|uniref:N-glycosyltransferase n=1 Tax=Hartmannibacter diazotrophicus TaxID=1482074 RepID=A0A2C9DCM8_9HYPH|nr:glycosyltransferase family 2 protein [Hartmannibacter diazotrophicus]SON58074.1 N-glycosyltransferase [Hartmannibacter diazotrophicus]